MNEIKIINYVKSIEDDIVKLIKNAGLELLKYKNKNKKVTNKEHLDIVTQIDKDIETLIINHLLKNYPSHKIKSEEMNNNLNNNLDSFIWIIDPIDGTINYISGLPQYSISIALQKNNKTYLGIIFEPEIDNLYKCILNNGSYLNSQKLKISNTNKLSESVISFILTSHYDKNKIRDITTIINNIAYKVRGLRLYVSFALELAYVASGKMTGTFSIKSKGYSSAAGLLLVTEAGGQISTISGENISSNSTTIVATNGLIHSKLIQEINNIKG